MIDEAPIIDINFQCENLEQWEKYKSEVEKIRNDFKGLKYTTDNKLRLQHEILWLQEYININELNHTTAYYNKGISVELNGPAAYNNMEWLLKDILLYHKTYISENHKVKDTYSRIEVNNMLFDLKASGIINSYNQIAEPFQTSFNDQPYPKDETIEVGLKYNRVIDEGYTNVEPVNFGKTLKDLTITIDKGGMDNGREDDDESIS